MRVELLLASTLLLAPLSAAASGRVTFVEGGATRTPDGGPAVPLTEGAEVVEHDRIETAAGARLELTFSDGSIVRLGERSRLTLEKLEQHEQSLSVRVTMALGQLWAKVARQPDPHFEVRTERMVAGVRGTSFLVEAAAAHAVVVLEGAVEVGGGKLEQAFRVESDKALAVDAEGRTAGVTGIDGRHDFDTLIRWALQFERDRGPATGPRRDGTWLERRHERRDEHKRLRRDSRVFGR